MSKKLPCVVISILAFVCGASAQLSQNDTGIHTGGTYAGDHENISVKSGNLNLQIPLVHFPGRAGDDFALSLSYNSNFWYAQATQNYPYNLWARDVIQPYLGAGWSLGLPSFAYSNSVQYSTNVKCYSNFTFVLPDGGKYFFGINQLRVNCQKSFGGSAWVADPADNLLTAVDGSSGLKLYSSADLTTLVAILRNGQEVRYNWPSQTGITMVDRNGNEINYSGNYTITDTVGRTITVNPTYTQITYPDESGTATITINYTNISLGTNINFPCGTSYPVNNYGATSTISSIVLPNGTQYTFTYDNYGEITKVTYPSGGYTRYDWSSVCLAFSPVGTNLPNDRYITAKHVCRDYSGAQQGSCSSEDTTTYGYSETTNPNSFTATITQTPANNQQNIVVTKTWDTTATAHTKIYDGSTLKKSVDTTYTSIGGLNGVSDIGPITQVVTLDDGSQSTNAWQYADASGGYFYPSDAKEYDFSGTLFRETVTSYWQDIPNGVNGYGIPTNIYGLPAVVTVKGGSGSQLSKTTYNYDETALTVQSNVVSHDSGYGSGGTRGNLTSVVKSLSSGSATTKRAYDNLGNVIQEWTANEVANPTQYPNSWQYSYSDNFSSTSCAVPGGQSALAYRTKTTNPLKQNSQQMIYPCSGLTYSTTDANGASTTYQYDSMHRLIATNFPDGGATLVSYDDPSLPETVTTTRHASPDPNVVVAQTLDGLGRGVSTTTAGIEVDTTYDGVGRIAAKSNPYTVGYSTSGWTSFTYDALDRMVQVTNPDSTYKGMAYAGPVSSTTDEGNGSKSIVRASKLDALGRLIAVCEVSSTTQANNAAPSDCGFTLGSQHFTGFLTSYQYDGLGNLTGASQAGLNPRSFGYDALSRLVCAVNPENRADGTQAPACTTTGQPGQTSYSYDADNNLMARTRPAPNQTSPSATVTASYAYDELDRLTQTTYSDNATPNVTRAYDQASVLGVTVSNPIGRLTSEYTSTSAHPSAITGAYWTAFDAVGRPKTWYVCTPAYCGTTTGSLYPILVGYDEAGSKTMQTDGLGNTVSYTYDNGSRLAGITLTTASVVPPHLTTLASSTSYGPFGLTNVQFGNNTTEQRSYYDGSACSPARSWLCQIQMGSPTGTGTYATGSISVQGSENSKQVQTQAATPGTGSVTIRGTSDKKYCSDYLNGKCLEYTYDEGTVSITVNGHVDSYYYSQYDTASTVASNLAAAINADGQAFVTASASNDVVSLTAKQPWGSQTNYPLSASIQTTDSTHFGIGSFPPTASNTTLIGGQNAQYTTIYDSGTVTLTVSFSGTTVATASYGYGQNTTSSQIAGGLASSISTSTAVNATASGNTINLTAKNEGPNGDYSLAITSAWDTTDFPGPSYPNQSSAMTGGSFNFATAYSVALSYAHDGQVTNANDTVNGNWTYTYDDFNRLSTGNGTALTFSYDQFGNRWKYNAQSLTFSGANNHVDGLSYDAAGNLLKDLVPHNYTYDAENRLVTVDGATTYVYDAEGRRVAKQGGTSREYLYDLEGNAMTELQPPNSNWVKTDVFGFGHAVATFDWYTTEFHTADWLGTRRADTDNCGNLIYGYQSMPFGDGLQTVNHMTPCAANTPDTERHFTGKERDSESALDMFGARYYGSGLGRFMTPDWAGKPTAVPYANFGNPQSLNLYSYVNNNPTAIVDPEGHCPECFEAIQEIADSPVGEAVENWGEQAIAAAGALVTTAVAASGNLGNAYQSYYHGELQNPDGSSIFLSKDNSAQGGKDVPNPNGTKGAPDHQQTADEEAARMGPNGQREVRVETPGGEKGSRRIDAAKVENGKVTEATQIIRPNKNGTPPAREIRAAKDIENATGVKPKMVPVRPCTNGNNSGCSQ